MIELSTPPDLLPGASFRFIVVTENKVSGGVADPAFYDSVVAADTAGFTYEKGPIGWTAVISTPTADARDRVGGFATNTPVYVVAGYRVADDMSANPRGLWAGSLLAPADKTVAGATINDYVWSGSTNYGTAYPTGPIGSTYPRIGLTGYANTFLDYSHDLVVNTHRVYGISNVLTAPIPLPEPGCLTLAGVIAFLILTIHLKNRFRALIRSGI